MRQKIVWLGLLIFAIGAYGCEGDGSDGACADPSDPRCSLDCGNGYCEQYETYSNCPADCDPGCGDTVCTENESNMVGEFGMAQACPTDCAPYCGDGYLDSRETCEDWNTIPGDGCSPYCRVEQEEQSTGCCNENVNTCPQDCTSF